MHIIIELLDVNNLWILKSHPSTNYITLSIILIFRFNMKFRKSVLLYDIIIDTLQNKLCIFNFKTYNTFVNIINKT